MGAARHDELVLAAYRTERRRDVDDRKRHLLRSAGVGWSEHNREFGEKVGEVVRLEKRRCAVSYGGGVFLIGDQGELEGQQDVFVHAFMLPLFGCLR